MRRKWIAWIAAFCTLFLSLGGPALARQGEGAAAGGAQEPPRYRLRPGDVIEVTVQPQGREYNKQLKILPDGRINYIGGEIVAAGMTIADLEKVIHDRLSGELRMHRVTVTVVSTPPEGAPGAPAGRVTILGAVRQPSVVSIQENMRVIEALAQAGGPTENADLKHVTITRDDLTTVVVDLTNRTMPQNVALRNRDVIFVPELEKQALTATALGQFVKPGPYALKPGDTLLELIQQAGGPTPEANLKSATLRRVGQEQPLPIDLEQLWVHGDASLNLPLVQGDILIIPASLAKAYVVGAVSQPGAVPVKGGESLLDILVRGGAPTQNANLSRVTVSRLGPDGTRMTRTVNLGNLKKGGDIAAATMAVAPGDIVVIPTQKQKPTTFERIAAIAAIVGLVNGVAPILGIDFLNQNNGGRRGRGRRND